MDRDGLVVLGTAPLGLSTGRRNLMIGGCVLANMVDGFDVLATAFTGSAIMADWRLDPQTLGVIFSAGLAGMVLGSLFISPLADRFGRRPVSLACMFGMTVGMFAAANSGDPMQLILARLVTGLGIGGVLATLSTTVAEVAPPEWRNRTMALFAAGYPLGSILGGLLAVGLVRQHGWHTIFLIGGLLTGLVFIVNFFSLTESSVKSQRLEMFGREFPGRLFGGEKWRTTLAFCAAFLLHMIAFFFVLSWTPKLTEALGFSPDTGNLVTIMINAGSLIGPLIFGFFADRFGLLRMAGGYFAAFAILTAAFAIQAHNLTTLYGLALFIGLAMGGAMTSLYTMAPAIFGPEVRSAGTGLAIGVGRVGGTLGPLLAGWALAAGMGRSTLYFLFALPLLMVFLILRSGLIALPQPATERRA